MSDLVYNPRSAYPTQDLICNQEEGATKLLNVPHRVRVRVLEDDRGPRILGHHLVSEDAVWREGLVRGRRWTDERDLELLVSLSTGNHRIWLWVDIELCRVLEFKDC